MLSDCYADIDNGREETLELKNKMIQCWSDIKLCSESVDEITEEGGFENDVYYGENSKSDSFMIVIAWIKTKIDCNCYSRLVHY